MKRETWFKKNTFHHSDFSDLRELLKIKEKMGIKISVGIPTKNEEEGIGKVLKTIKKSLILKYPLVDELVVIDSRSEDRTIKIAQDLGVEVYQDDKILPQLGSKKGKGEALWKSLAVLNGDIICWVDGDIKNFHPRFIYGLVGVLLKNEEIKFIKGYFKRPFVWGKFALPAAGGRVTEILARPLINIFWPKLSFLVQPLSGEYALWRNVLENLPFSTGYGVEIGMIIDVFKKYGLQSIAQVDLEKKIHSSQPLGALGEMSFSILQTVIKRLREEGRLKYVKKTWEFPEEKEELIFHRIFYGKEYGIKRKKIKEEERPPLKDVTTKLILVRHGETDWNKKGRIQSSRDIPLNKKGKSQASIVRKKLARYKIDAIYSSPLKRAFDTAKEIAKDRNIKIKIDKNLKEIDQGRWEGMFNREVKIEYPGIYKKWEKDPLSVRPPDGESVKEFSKKVIYRLKKILNKNKGKTICIVSHKMTLGVIKCYYRDIKLSKIKDVIPENAQVETIYIETRK